MQEKLHPFHVTLLIYMTQTGVVIFSLPRLLAESFGYNGWIFLGGCAVLSAINIFLISIVYRKSKGRSVFDIMEQSVPKLLLYPLYMVLVILWSLLGCMVAKQYSAIFQLMAFPNSHPMIFKGLVDILIFFLVIKGIYNISKAATSFFLMSFWMMFLLLFFFNNFEWARLTPFFLKGGTNSWIGGLDIYTAFLGYEAALFLIPFADKNGRFIRAVHIGNLMTVFGYIAVAFVCFGFYSINQLKRMEYPLLDLLSYIRLPFIERIENFLFGIFLFSVLITVSIYIWMSLEATKRMLPKADSRWLLAFIILAIYVISWYPDDSSEVDNWLRYLAYAEAAVSLAVPILVIIILAFQKGARGNG